MASENGVEYDDKSAPLPVGTKRARFDKNHAPWYWQFRELVGSIMSVRLFVLLLCSFSIVAAVAGIFFPQSIQIQEKSAVICAGLGRRVRRKMHKQKVAFSCARYTA